jgi:hypothetical protein
MATIGRLLLWCLLRAIPITPAAAGPAMMGIAGTDLA